MSKKTAVIICAAGSSSRFGGSKKKVFSDVGGRAAFLRSVEAFSDRDDVGQVILAVSPEDREMVDLKWGPNMKFFNVKICNGGPERFDTVRNALELVSDDMALAAIHDAARCCLKEQWINSVFEKAGRCGAAILAAPVVATLKKVDDGQIAQTVDRSLLWEAQTPQVFDLALLRQAYSRLDSMDKDKISDDSQLVEALGHKVSVVQADQSNIKITYSADTAVAEAIIKSRSVPRSKGYQGPYAEAKW